MIIICDIFLYPTNRMKSATYLITFYMLILSVIFLVLYNSIVWGERTVKMLHKSNQQRYLIWLNDFLFQYF